VCVSKEGTFLLCSTFTGIIFGLTRSEPLQSLASTNNTISLSKANQRESENLIEALKLECDILEKQIVCERERYQELTCEYKVNKKAEHGMSVLPYFAINDSIILHQG